jgi:hypothetical protein
MTVSQQPQPDRCERCHCDDCGGTLANHVGARCHCEDCAAMPDYACDTFILPRRISHLAEQLGPLLSVHLGARQQRRCLAVAHVAHHALIDYDTQRES